ncbi:hypothetical protein Q648_00094 [Bartonella quintana JK 12]|uniref:Uncharacterized protein n=2 Tax=Bartonella quintana TaxID=803 RepID=W3TYA2_BARQI|nr:hypothetical protein Q651_00410 [Bartonella quintana BQ2-D70]ETS13887.1 hypothetical protein Q650_00503 [Bartonella quintana JK 73rel]ETS15574.1 hypothetical protein Q649_00512 [Bartonella quintana JK 73]ETS17579.1 hypothetical protein Q647_00503 [Bartonella quintana JK 7]ETS18410.1 hypothetical protein Q648_00094 [Bartonella quintana JK 12]KEC59408.1 hypothetical protein O93_00739 [Bartonella quintana JK 19]KEC62483.1 hypothetical protein O7Y_00520 [Bartonella quintana JK 63]KEC63658.1 h
MMINNNFFDKSMKRKLQTKTPIASLHKISAFGTFSLARLLFYRIGKETG